MFSDHDRGERRVAGHPEPEPGHALVGHDLDDEVLAAVELELAHHDRRRQRDAAGRGADLGDLHVGAPVGSTRTSSSGRSSLGPTPARNRSPSGPASIAWTSSIGRPQQVAGQRLEALVADREPARPGQDVEQLAGARVAVRDRLEAGRHRQQDVARSPACRRTAGGRSRPPGEPVVTGSSTRWALGRRRQRRTA